VRNLVDMELAGDERWPCGDSKGRGQCPTEKRVEFTRLELPRSSMVTNLNGNKINIPAGFHTTQVRNTTDARGTPSIWVSINRTEKVRKNCWAKVWRGKGRVLHKAD